VLRFENRYRELALESSFPVASGRILSRALPPRDPAAPRAVPTLAAGMFLGLLLGLAAAVLREARETGFRSGGDVTQGPRAAVSGICAARDPERNGSWQASLRAWSVGGAPRARIVAHGTKDDVPRRRTGGFRHAISPNPMPDTRVRHPTPRPPQSVPRQAEFDQAVRGVFSLLHARRLQRHGRVIAVASLQAGEDSAAIAVELARQTIRAGRRCLLVDGDLTGAELSRHLGLTGAEGTLDVLDGACGLEAALRSDLADDLEVLAAGQGDEPDRALAYFTEFGELIGDLAEGYDDVVLHLPPLLDMPEAQGLLARADHVLLAVAWGRTPRRLVRAFVAEAPGLRGPGAAVVLSRVALRRLSRYGVIRPRRPVWKSGRRTAKSS
jgi:Mrp family chromosome partitioning ATPase